MNLLRALPPYPLSTAVPGMTRRTEPFTIGFGDMWPITWAEDDQLYTSGGDNSGFTPDWHGLNFWRVEGTPPAFECFPMHTMQHLWEVPMSAGADSLKPAGIISIDGVLYLAVEDMAYISGPRGNQINLTAWLITSHDHGATWSPTPTGAERAFFSGRFASPHFLQFGRDYAGARDEYVYAYSCTDDDGIACWNAGDVMYLGRAPRHHLLERDAWEFFCGTPEVPAWTPALDQACPVFAYPRKCNENEVVYHSGLGRYLLCNWAFIDYVNYAIGSRHAELTIFEAPEPWGPWALVYREEDWGPTSDYQPRLPTKWFGADGRTAWLLSSGNFTMGGGRGHYGLTVSQVEFGTGNYGDITPRELPRALRDVTAMPLNDHEICVSWDADINAGYYRVYRDDERLVDVPDFTRPPQYLDAAGQPGHPYTYTVQPFTVDGDPGPLSAPVTARTTPPLPAEMVGVNIQGGAVVIRERVFQGEASSAIQATSGAVIDMRIRTLAHVPDAGDLDPLLRSFANIRAHFDPHRYATCTIPRAGRPAERAEVTIYAVNTHLCGSPAAFQLYLQGVHTDDYHPQDERTWHALGPYQINLAAGQPLIVEARRPSGLGGIAAIEVRYLPGA